MHTLDDSQIKAITELKKIYVDIPYSSSISKIALAIDCLQTYPDSREINKCRPYAYSVSDNEIYSQVCMIDLKSAYPTYIINNNLQHSSFFKLLVSLRNGTYSPSVEPLPGVKFIQNALTGLFKSEFFKCHNYPLYYKIIGGVRKIIEDSISFLNSNGCKVLYSFTDSIHFIFEDWVNIPTLIEQINEQNKCTFQIERVADKVLYPSGFGDSCPYFYSAEVP